MMIFYGAAHLRLNGSGWLFIIIKFNKKFINIYLVNQQRIYQKKIL